MNTDIAKTKDLSGIRLLTTQLMFENDSWRRTLEFLEEEDVNLKIHLSDILKNLQEPNRDSLDRIEHLYNRLLSENEYRAIIGMEVSDIEKQLSLNITDNKDHLQPIQEKQNKLRKEMEIVEQRFHNLKQDFTNYFSEIVKLNVDND